MANYKLTVKIYAERNGHYENDYISRVYSDKVDANLEFDRLLALTVKQGIVKQKILRKLCTYDSVRKHVKYTSVNYEYTPTMKEKITLWVDSTNDEITPEANFKEFIYDRADQIFDNLIAREEAST